MNKTVISFAGLALLVALGSGIYFAAQAQPTTLSQHQPKAGMTEPDTTMHGKIHPLTATAVIHDSDARPPAASTSLAPLSDAQLQQRLQSTSLANTEPPAISGVDAQGNLQLDQELRDLFDYFLSLQGEQSAADIAQLMQGYLATHLPEKAAAQAVNALHRYQALQARLDADAATASTDDTLAEKLQHLVTLRRQILGDTLAEAFFAEDEAYDRYSLQKMAEYATDQDNAAAIGQWESASLETLPEDLRERQQARQQQQHLLEGTRKLEQEGASASTIYQYQVLHGDTAAAERYQALNEQRQQWQQRLNEFHQQRADIENLDIIASDKAARIEQLLANSFEKNEILRVRVLENMEE